MQCWSSQNEYQPIEVDRTEGCWIYTPSGRRIFDLRSAHECINIGFNHPAVIEAMKKQMDSVCYVTDDFSTPATASLAKLLSDLTPGTGKKKVWFGQSGAAAIEAAIKAARFYAYQRTFSDFNKTDRGTEYYPYPYKIISRYRSWHGATSGALSVSGDPRKWFAEPMISPGVVMAPEVYPYRSPLGDDPDGLKSASYLRHIVEMEGGSAFVAAIIVEPVVGSNGIIPTPEAYLKAVRSICDDHHLLMIVDETMTGMGRTGTFLAIEDHDIVPDIITMGKAMGAYSPISATIFSEKVSQVFDVSIFGHGQSYSGHALSAAAALESIKVLRAEILPEVKAKGAYLSKGLQDIANNRSYVGDVRGKGLMWTMELLADPDKKTSFRSFNEKYVENPVKKLARYLLDEKDIYTPGDKFGLWIVPPLVVSFNEIDWLLNQLSDALDYFETHLI